MARIEASEIFKVLVTAVVVNTFFAVFLMTWVTKDDLSSLPDDLGDRFIHLFYFGVVSFTTTGYGDITPKSNRLKIVMACYLLLVIAGVFSYFFRF
jgi:hypothetical protein